MPLRSDLQQAKNALEEQPAELVQVSLSPQQQYLLLLVHQAAESAVLEVLRPFGFAAASFGTLTGTVQENLQRLDDEEEQTRQDRRAEDAALDALGGRQPELKLGLDRLKLQIQREDNRQRLLTDGHIFYLEGWVPEADTARLEQLLGGLLLCVGPAGPHRGGVSGGAGDAEEQLAHPVHDLHHGAVLHARL